MKKCNNCGTEQPDESLFCEECGARLENNGSGIPAAMPDTKASAETSAENADEAPEIPAPTPKIPTGMMPPTDRFTPAQRPDNSAEVVAEAPEKAATEAATEVVEDIVNDKPTAEEPEQSSVVVVPETKEQLGAVAPTEEQPAVEEKPVEEKPAEEKPIEEKPATENPVSVEQLLAKDQQMQKADASTHKKTFMVVAVIICIALALTFVVSIIVSNMGTGSNRQQSSQPAPTQQTTNNSSSTSNEPETQVATVGNIEFTIPEEYAFEEGNNELAIYGDDGVWALRVKYDDADYAKIAANLDALKQRIKDSGYTITQYGVEKYGGVEYMWFDVDIVETGDKGVLAVTEAPDQGTFKITLVDIDQTQDHSYLEDVASIINSATRK